MEEELVITQNEDGTDLVTVKTVQHGESDLEIAPLLPFFNIDNKVTNKERQMLEDINEFLKEDTDVSNEANVFMALRNVEEKLSSPRIGETRISKIHQYVRSIKAIKEAEKERDAQLR